MVVGQGGRENALAWKLAREEQVERVWVAPGNAGTEAAGAARLAAGDAAAWLAQARAQAVDLTVVGPEQPLADGIADAFAAAGLPIVGPSAAAARIESSKIHAKELLDELGIPTAAWTPVRQAGDAEDFLARREPPYMVKADGLAGGKGAAKAASRGAARELVAAWLGGGFGAASRQLVLEEFIPGEERTLVALCDGERALPLPLARDYKSLHDGGAGPNTGGMGAVCPAAAGPGGPDAAQLCAAAIEPVLAKLRERGTPYRGFMYAGLMLKPDGGWAVLEYNCRLGDPETQATLPLLADSLAELLRAAAAGRLAGPPPRWRDAAAVCVTLAAAGYPQRPRLGQELAAAPPPAGGGLLVFHAGTAPAPGREGACVVSGGRVLNVVGVAPDRARARAIAYRHAASIELPGAQMRGDIGAES